MQHKFIIISIKPYFYDLFVSRPCYLNAFSYTGGKKNSFEGTIVRIQCFTEGKNCKVRK